MKKVLFLVACTSMSAASFAQISIGFRGGVNFSQTAFDPKPTTSSSSTSTSSSSVAETGI